MHYIMFGIVFFIMGRSLSYALNREYRKSYNTMAIAVGFASTYFIALHFKMI